MFSSTSTLVAFKTSRCSWSSAIGYGGGERMNLMMGRSLYYLNDNVARMRGNAVVVGSGQCHGNQQGSEWMGALTGSSSYHYTKSFNDIGVSSSILSQSRSGRRIRNTSTRLNSSSSTQSGNGNEGSDISILPHAMLKQMRPLNTARMVKVKHVLVSGDMVGVVKEQLTAALVDAGSEGTERDDGRMSEIMSDIAQQYSTCPSGRNGGDLGWVSVGQMVQEFEDVCFRSRPGEIVECDTEYGHHIVYIEGERKQGEIKPMTVEQLSELLTVGSTEGIESVDAVQLIDVREPSEVETASLPGFWRVYSLSQFGEWGPNVEYMLDPDMTTVVLCHHGVRSAQVCQFLLRQNFADLRNVTGGIAAYSRMVDPSVPEY